MNGEILIKNAGNAIKKSVNKKSGLVYCVDQNRTIIRDNIKTMP